MSNEETSNVSEAEPTFSHYKLQWYDSFSANRTDSYESGVQEGKYKDEKQLFDQIKYLMDNRQVRWRDLRLFKVYSDHSEHFASIIGLRIF